MKVDGKNFRVKVRLPDGKVWVIAVYSESRSGAKSRAFKRLVKKVAVTREYFNNNIVELKMIDKEKQAKVLNVTADAPRDYTAKCTFDIDCDCIQCGGL